MGPHLVRQPDGAVVLVENGRHRELQSSPVAEALERLLGPPREAAGPGLGARERSHSPAVALAAPAGFEALAEHAPKGSLILVADPRGAEPRVEGRTVQPIHLHRPAPATRGKPPEGLGLLEQVTLAQARGGTHLILSMSSAGWLRRFPDLAAYLSRCARVVACNDAGAMWSLPRPLDAGAPKVFCIGLTKTGTSSLHAALKQLGLHSLHWGDLRAHPSVGTAGLAAVRAVREAQRDGERLLHHLGEQYDAYSDVGALSARFDLADLQYPGSRFILTVREVDEWIDSRRRQVQLHQRQHDKGLYQGLNLRVDESRWRAEGEAHIDRVMDHFADRDDLLVLDICAGEGWERLAPFLGRPVPVTQFPTENVGDRPPRRSALVRVVGSHLPPRLARYVRHLRPPPSRSTDQS